MPGANFIEAAMSTQRAELSDGTTLWTTTTQTLHIRRHVRHVRHDMVTRQPEPSILHQRLAGGEYHNCCVRADHPSATGGCSIVKSPITRGRERMHGWWRRLTWH